MIVTRARSASAAERAESSKDEGVRSRWKGHAGMRVLVLGASGTIGSAVVHALTSAGHAAVGLVRPGKSAALRRACPDAEWREGFATDPSSLRAQGLRGERFDALISCMASRSGVPSDAWHVDYHAHRDALHAAQQSGIAHFVLLSALCVQKPLLAFQQAKRAFELLLCASGMSYAIVRPTAFFKSLAGQIARVRAGKAFLVVGDGRLTRCTPISDRDLAVFIVRCLQDADLHQRILPIGGPGPAISPLEQAEILFALLRQPPRIRKIPVMVLDLIVGGLSAGSRLLPRLAVPAELARIGRYYARESMLVLDPVTGCYDAKLTPSTGTDTLADFYAAVLDGRESLPSRGEHAVF